MLGSDSVPAGAGDTGTERQGCGMQLDTGPLGGVREIEQVQCGLAAERGPGKAASASSAPCGLSSLEGERSPHPPQTTRHSSMHIYLGQALARSVGLLQTVLHFFSCEHLYNFAISISQIAKEEMRLREVS